MPDITMCKGEGCLLKGTCYRHTTSSSSFLQSWFAEPPNIVVSELEHLCNYYIYNRTEEHYASEE